MQITTNARLWGHCQRGVHNACLKYCSDIILFLIHSKEKKLHIHEDGNICISHYPINASGVMMYWSQQPINTSDLMMFIPFTVWVKISRQHLDPHLLDLVDCQSATRELTLCNQLYVKYVIPSNACPLATPLRDEVQSKLHLVSAPLTCSIQLNLFKH
jgi:hypothetical protein